MSSYDLLADEYYDPRHITSRNFDAATNAYLRRAGCGLPSVGLILDAGAGRGRATQFCNADPRRTVQVDISRSMLVLSGREPTVARVQCDAQVLPFRDASFAAVTAFLFDPFNEPRFYEGVSRVLIAGGRFLGTLPHEKWGRSLRAIRGYSINKSRMIKRDGSVVERDSFLLSEAEIRRQIEAVGMVVDDLVALCLPADEEVVSPDIVAPATQLGIDPHELAIVTLIAARKP